jgi:hypothetical protein
LQHLLGHLPRVLVEILPQDLVGIQINIHPLRCVQRTQLTLEHQAIKATQNSQDDPGKPL